MNTGTDVSDEQPLNMDVAFVTSGMLNAGTDASDEQFRNIFSVRVAADRS